MDTPSSNSDDLLTASQVAALLGCKPRTVREYRRTGKLKALEYSKRMHRYRRADVEAFLAQAANDYHPSGLTGEHDVVLDAINSESLHNE